MGKKGIRFIQDMNYITKYGVENGSGDGYQKCMTFDIQSSLKEHEYGAINCITKYNGKEVSIKIPPSNLLLMITEVIDKMRTLLMEADYECTLVEFPTPDPNVLYFVDAKFDETYGMYRIDICKSKTGTSEEGAVEDTFFVRPDWMIEIYEKFEELRRSLLIFNENWINYVIRFANNNIDYRDRRNRQASIAIQMSTLCIICYNIVSEINSLPISILALAGGLIATFGIKYKK